MVQHLFCARCYNFVDACDCIDYSYSLEVFGTDRTIPEPPETAPPEVGTVWYFRVPVKELYDILSQSQSEKVGLDLLLAVEELWTLEPQGDPSLYLSVPVDRLKHTEITLSLKPFNKYTMPWEMNFFNFNSPMRDLATLAQELAKCAKRKVGRRLCSMKAFGISFFEGFNMESPPVPKELLEFVASLPYGSIDPNVIAAVVLTMLPPSVVKSINDAYKTAVDFYWIYQHLIDTTDPPLGYEDSETGVLNCILNFRDCMAESVDFPSFASKAGNKGPTIITPDRKTPPRSPFNELELNLLRWKPEALNPTVILHEDEEIRGPTPVVVTPIVPVVPLTEPPSGHTVVKTSNPFRLDNAGTANYPTCWQLLSNPGTNQTQFLNYPCAIHDIVSGKAVTGIATQQSIGFTDFIFVGVAGGGTGIGSAFGRSFTFTLTGGTDTSLVFLQDGVTTTVAAVAGVLTYSVNFINTRQTQVHFCYKVVRIRGSIQVSPSNTSWNITTPTGVTAAFFTPTFSPLNTCLYTPVLNGTYTTEGYGSNFQFVNGVTYISKTFIADPSRQPPASLSVRNEINMVSFAPNSLVTPTTFGYVVGRSGGVGGSGSAYLPFNPTGLAVPVSYELNFTKSQGQSFVTGIISYG